MTERLPTHEIDTDLVRLNYGAEEGEELSPRAAVSALCDVVDEYRADRDRLASLVERCPWYMRHSLNCASIAEGVPLCSCGLLDLLTEMETG